MIQATFERGYTLPSDYPQIRDREKLAKEGRKILQGKGFSNVKKITLVNLSESRGADLSHGISLIPQSVLPTDVANKLLGEMVASSRSYDLLTGKEMEKMVKRSGKTYQKIREESPDYKDFDIFNRMKIEQGQWEKRGEQRIFHGSGAYDGILIVSLADGQMGGIYFRNLIGDHRLFFWTHTGSWLTHETDPMAGIVSMPEGFLEAIHVAEFPRPGIISPKLSSAEVNEKFRRKFGSGYERALEYLRRSAILGKEVGSIQDIRPAGGENKSYSWLEYSGDFSFWVLGDKGKAYVQVKQFDVNISGKLIQPKAVIELEKLRLHFDPKPKIN